MLLIAKEVLTEITSVFRKGDAEQGFLLGCDRNFDYINHCSVLFPIESGPCYYVPDSNRADELIRRWAERQICFCGMVHSHLVNKTDLSESDIDFAKELYLAYRLPKLWFAIGVRASENMVFRFYSVSERDGEILVSPEDFAVEDNRFVLEE